MNTDRFRESTTMSTSEKSLKEGLIALIFKQKWVKYYLDKFETIVQNTRTYKKYSKLETP